MRITKTKISADIITKGLGYFILKLILSFILLGVSIAHAGDRYGPVPINTIEPEAGIILERLKKQKHDTNLRPGDVLRIDFPGEVNFEPPFPIDSDGFVLLPEVGRIQLNGKTLEQATEMITIGLSAAYKDIERINVF